MDGKKVADLVSYGNFRDEHLKQVKLIVNMF